MNRRSEDVQEQEGEDDRLDRHVAQSLGDPREHPQSTADQQSGLSQIAAEPGGSRRKLLSSRRRGPRIYEWWSGDGHAASLGSCGSIESFGWDRFGS